VKVRWSDGIEGLGEVVRTDKVRDVALIKTDPRGREPIRLRRGALQPGDTVFAIGAPLGDKFQSTVTRGVISAYRTFEGVSFIQSDVSVNPGSSGGPLLDDKGAVVGLTESGYQAAGAPTGINLFVPIGDALDFLNAQPQ
jgi:S1-C subfamily serine protease